MNIFMRTSLLGASLFILASCGKPNVTISVPVHNYGASAGNGSLGLHTVRQGETVWMISQRYNLALRDVLDVNHLQPPYRLSSGDRLTLPAPQTYRVRKGDSLYTISQMFNTSASDIARLNRLQPPYNLTAGRTLRLPPKYESAPVLQPVAARAVPDRPAAVAVPRPSGVERSELPPPSAPPQVQTASAVSSPVPPPPEQVIGKTPAREGKFIKPVSGKIISSYGIKKDGLHNDGINIQAARGDAVRAAESGVVVYTGSQIEGYGNLILIRHADQYVTAYAHLDKTLVKKGDKVKRGQTIGTVGSTGSVDKAQLHFEIRKGTKALDPSGLMDL
jgi:murein DD-endopeptidase MepM/ murein hydrolase activator NlpD